MLCKRIGSWLIVAAVILGGAARARALDDAQPFTAGGIQPFGPIDLGSIADMQLFAPPESLSESQDGYFHGNTGPFFEYERLYWSIHQPGYAPIGVAGPAEIPTINASGAAETSNGFVKPNFIWGNRFTLGYQQEDGYGWAASFVKSNFQYSSELDNFPINTGFIRNATIDISDPITGIDLGEVKTIIPVLYQPLSVVNVSRFTGAELMKTYRFEPGHNGGIWEFMFGARFFQFHDRFSVNASTIPFNSTTIDDVDVDGDNDIHVVTINAAKNFWDTSIDNNIVGPQFGLHWEQKKERWTIDTELRFTAGANFQNASQTGATGATIVDQILGAPGEGEVFSQPAVLTPDGQPSNSFSHKLYQVTFAPIGEFRLDTQYQLTKSCSIKMGYTGLLISGIGRASQRINYTLPDLGILNGANKTSLYINGVTMGFEFNH